MFIRRMKASNELLAQLYTASSLNAKKTRVSGVQLAASQASSFELFTQINADER
ncbi:MAG: hypothetical protein OXI23_02625 [Gemmatimonadota bacterium]|nr:hypothetical protein [Gemmatimonadota bacterium]